MSDGIIKCSIKYDNIYSSELIYAGPEIKVLFSGSCLEQDEITYIHGKIVNI